MKAVRRTVSIFAAPIALVMVGAFLQVFGAAVILAEGQAPDEAPNPFEFLKQSVELAIDRTLSPAESSE